MSLLINKSAIRDRCLSEGAGRITQVSPFLFELANRMVEELIQRALRENPRSSTRLNAPTMLPPRG